MRKFLSSLPTDVELAVIWWGQSNASPKGARSLAFSYRPELALPDAGFDLTSATTTSGGASDTITLTTPTLLDPGDWVGAEFRRGSPGSPLVGYGIVTANTLTTLTVTWTVAPSGGSSTNGYVCFRDGRRKSYSQVRVLTPYLPETAIAYPASVPVAPGYTFPASITSAQDAALFLPLTFKEGVQGYGVSDSSGGGAATAAGATTFDFTTAITAGVLAGGYVRVQHTGGTSWSNITDNTSNQLTGLSWQGAGTPSGTASTWLWEAWVPHFDNHPSELLWGFRYPNNYSQPFAPLRVRPRGTFARAYPDNYGAMSAFAWRLSQLTGRRIHVVHLGIGASSIMENFTLTGPTPPIGWWSGTVRGDWHPSAQSNLAARIQRMLTVQAPAALLAEGNTKPIRYIGIGGMQGETECGLPTGRENYGALLSSFYKWIGSVVRNAGLSLYEFAELPMCHGKVATYPWVTAVDTGGLVNKAISDYTAKAPFGSSFEVDTATKTLADPLHFDGQGEVMNGLAAATAIETQIDAAASLRETADNPVVIEVCNSALTSIGEGGRITSLDATVDPSVQASLCARFYRESRDILLQRHLWSFALRRETLVPLLNYRSSEWAYAYAMPRCAVRVFAVLPKDAGDDYVVQAEAGAIQKSGGMFRADVSVATSYTPQKFTVETDADGVQVIYSNCPKASARFNALVADAAQYSPEFRQALSWTLAAKLAGAMMKGEQGAAMTRQCLVFAEKILSDAKVHDAAQRNIRRNHVVPWIAGR